jgi:hypothetical protein
MPAAAEGEYALAPVIDGRSESTKRVDVVENASPLLPAIEDESYNADCLFAQVALGHVASAAPALLNDRAASVDALMAEDDLIARLNAGPWTLPTPRISTTSLELFAD